MIDPYDVRLAAWDGRLMEFLHSRMAAFLPINPQKVLRRLAGWRSLGLLG